MAQKYEENTMFKDVTDMAYKLGANRSPKAVNVSKYQNLGAASYSSPKYSGTTPTSLTNLGTTTTPYGGSTKYESFHPGIDLANVIGTPIPTSLGGTVKEVVTGRKQGDKGYGNYVTIQDSYGNIHRYSHLQDAYVKVGESVPSGKILGSMGNTGSTYSTSGGTGSHLDYRIMDAYNKYMNPSEYLATHK